MESIYLLILALLIITTILAVVSMFFYEEYIKKICCLSVAYSSFLLFMIILSFRNGERLNAILTILVSILIIFAGNLLIGIGVARSINRR